MIETEQKVIGGAVYTATQLPARQALRLKTKILKMFGQSLSKIFQTHDEKTIEDSILAALPTFFCDVDERQFESLVLELLRGVRKDGVELTESIIDLEFAGKIYELYEVIWFVIDLNYRTFWKGGITGKR